MNILGKQIKCIAFDLDHTIVNSDGSISEATRRMISEAIAKGIVVIPVSGRAYDTFPEAIRQMLGITYVVTSNGAAVYDQRTDERIHGVTLEAEDVHKILEYLSPLFEDKQITYEAFVDGIAYAGKNYVEDPMQFGVPDKNVSYVKNTRNPKEDILKFMLQHIGELDSLDVVVDNPLQYQKIEEEILKITNQVYTTRAVSYRLEISHKNSGKASGLRYVLDLLGIREEETIAFGDGDNDAEMLALAGIGVAMENATAICKASADTVCGSCEADGVASYLQRY